MLAGRARTRRPGSSPAAGVGAAAHRALQAEEAALFVGLLGPRRVRRDRQRVGDRRVVVHHRHRLLGGPAVVGGDHRVLTGHERLDVGDVADAVGAPARRDPHAGAHRVDRAGVDRVQERRVGAVELDQREGERVVERVLHGGRGHPRPRRRPCPRDRRRRSRAPAPRAVSGSHSSGGTITRSPLRIPMIRRSVRAVMNAPTTGPERPLVRELDRALDGLYHSSSPRDDGLMTGD